MRNEWLDRDLLRSPVYFTLCTNAAQFHAELRSMKVPRDTWPNFLTTARADATAHFFNNPAKDVCCIVCIHPDKDRDQIEIAGLLVHEAVHIWQETRDLIGERNPSPEFEAYAVQSISQRLMWEYRRQVFGS
ncbi:hypothetical protein [Cupriavidus gilardii]|uniref:Uncharacterized protein n=1 Tax=Cupriavidus gilardii TaxID=82541 RepID=A0A849BD93_9BURK|nr:hypothetical protein [Cupriavidus gilardii]KAB0597783.1 hypothetical protein F7Q96_07635 [Cupriavidus gilardii]NNH12074.1 hypothetical protein [Cupriavidus gilardii]WNG69293.1 hypothetical protein QWJ31_19530 [Cupriavidus gilardii]